MSKSRSKSKALIATFTVMVTGLSITSLLQSPQAAYSQTDYEEYIVMENFNQQKINQQNVGSGSSTNINCGANIAGTNLAQPVTTCPSIPDDRNGNPPPNQQPQLVMTPRTETFEFPVNGDGTVTVTAECFQDEVVTGGGWISPGDAGEGLMEILRNEPSGNAWSIKASIGAFAGQSPGLTVYAMCLKMTSS